MSLGPALNFPFFNTPFVTGQSSSSSPLGSSLPLQFNFHVMVLHLRQSLTDLLNPLLLFHINRSADLNPENIQTDVNPTPQTFWISFSSLNSRSSFSPLGLWAPYYLCLNHSFLHLFVQLTLTYSSHLGLQAQEAPDSLLCVPTATRIFNTLVGHFRSNVLLCYSINSMGTGILDIWFTALSHSLNPATVRSLLLIIKWMSILKVVPHGGGTCPSANDNG